MLLVPVGEIVSRCRRLQERMARAGIEAMLALQSADLFYLAGSIQQGVLYVPVAGDPLYLVRRNLDRARHESPLRFVLPLKGFKDVLALARDAGLPAPKRVGVEADVLPLAVFRRLEAALPGVAFEDGSGLLKAIRSIKSPWEIDRVRETAGLLDRLFVRAVEMVRPGLSDLELSAALEHEARLLGHQGLVRMRAFNAELVFGLTASGATAGVPGGFDMPLCGPGTGPSVAQGATAKPIAAGEPIIVDLAACKDGYVADQTRTLCIGPLPDELARAHDDMMKVEDRLEQLARPGLAWGDLYESCLEFAVQAGHAARFMGPPGAQVGFIGHGVGVELDEAPYIARGFDRDRLEAGMVFAFEPKVVFEGVGAVGIEDTYAVTEDGLERLTGTPRQVLTVG